MEKSKIEEDTLITGNITGTISTSSANNTVFYTNYEYPTYLTVNELIKILKWAEDKGFETVDIKNFLAILLEYEEENRIKENIQLYGNYGSATTALFNGNLTTGSTTTLT